MSPFHKSSTMLRAARWSVGTLLTAVSLAASAQTAVVFDSLSQAQRFYSQCFVCTDAPAVQELGDIVTLAGTERMLQTITLGLEQDIKTSTVPYDLRLTLGLYNVDAGLQTSLIASRTVDFTVPDSGLYDVAISFRGVVVPNTFYYGVSAVSTSPQLAALRLTLWDYFDTSLYGDGQSVPVGTDDGTQVFGLDQVSSQVYVRLASDPTRLRVAGNDGWGDSLKSGFTPALQIIASPVPEPKSLALFLVGGLAMVLIGWRRGNQR